MRCRGNLFGAIVTLSGLFIIGIIVLPSCFWWLMLGVALVIAGLLLMGCRR